MPRLRIGERVAFHRGRLRLTMDELATRIGKEGNHSYISQLEHDRFSPTAEVVAGLAVALGVSADELLGLKPREGAVLPDYCQAIEEEPRLQQLLVDGWPFLSPKGRDSVLSVFEVVVDGERAARVLGRRPPQGKKRGTGRKAGEGEGEGSERAIVSPESARGE